MSEFERTLPLSIHPDPELYVDSKASPYSRIRRVIDQSDGGVLGVTGERGAGKSVLLNKLVAAYSSDFLTVNLSAPISSSREAEFFTMLFRYLVQQVITRLKHRSRERIDDIAEIGWQDRRRALRRAFFAFVIVYLAMTAVAGNYFLWYRHRRAVTAAQEAVHAAAVTAAMDAIRNAQAEGRMARAYGEAQSAGAHAAAVTESKDRLSALTSQRWPWFDSSGLGPTLLLLPLILLVLAVGSALLPFWRWFSHLRGLEPLERGLLIYSNRIAARLDYELTRTAERGLEVSPFGWMKGSGKLTSEEKARPISLPELTTSYIEFVSNVLRVFPGKLIICIDELDKVSDLDQVRFILREIKGALYVKNTFYVLSISNDALRSFEGRLGDQRDIFESTFDDVFPVRYLDLATCVAILEKRLTRVGGEIARRIFEPNRTLTLISLSSAGNARELIRSFRDCILGAEPGPSLQAPWTLLFNRRLDAIRDRAMVLGGSATLRSLFIPLLDFADSLSDDLQTWRNCRNSLHDFISNHPNDEAELTVATHFLRYVVEIEIFLQARRAVFGFKYEAWMKEASMLMKAYQLLPFSVSDAEKILDSQNEAHASALMEIVQRGTSLSVPAADRT